MPLTTTISQNGRWLLHSLNFAEPMGTPDFAEPIGKSSQANHQGYPDKWQTLKFTSISGRGKGISQKLWPNRSDLSTRKMPTWSQQKPCLPKLASFSNQC